MAAVVGFISEKGGVGKTTACYHIAIALSRFKQKRVLVIDADYQRGGISGRFFPALIEGFATNTPSGTTLFNKFQQLYSASTQTKDIDILDCGGNVHLVPADPRLATVSVHKLPGTNNIVQNNISLLSHLKTISFVLSDLRDSYDYILIDSHPEVSDIMRSIIYASDYCVSPVKLDRQSSIGVATVIGEITNVNNDISVIRRSLDVEDDYKDTIFSGAMGMMAREYGEALKQSEQLEYNRLLRSGEIFKNYVTEGDGLRIAAANRQTVFDVGGTNAAKQSLQFRSLTSEFTKVCP